MPQQDVRHVGDGTMEVQGEVAGQAGRDAGERAHRSAIDVGAACGEGQQQHRQAEHQPEAEALEAIALLVSEGADTTIENNRNLTPEEFAVASGRSQAAAALAEAIGGK